VKSIPWGVACLGIELLQGTLDRLILQAPSWGPQHGYGIGQAIRTGSSEVLHAETGSLYPSLHRLEKHVWVKSEWRQSENRPMEEPSLRWAGFLDRAAAAVCSLRLDLTRYGAGKVE